MDQQSPKVTVLPTRAAHGVRRPIVSRSGPSLVEIEVAPRSLGPAARPWERTGSMDVEELVVWSFRDQRADRHAAAGLHAIEAQAAGVPVQGRSGDGCATIDEYQLLGCRVDGGGMIKDDVHPVADAVARDVAELEEAQTVRHFGRLGVRPDGWREPERWYRPVVWVKPGVEGQWEWENEGRGKRGARLTRVIPTITPAELERRRAQYGRWHEALEILAWRLSSRALGFTVTGPAAPSAPWLDSDRAGR